jgi:hypothetical protein
MICNRCVTQVDHQLVREWQLSHVHTRAGERETLHLSLVVCAIVVCWLVYTCTHYRTTRGSPGKTMPTQKSREVSEVSEWRGVSHISSATVFLMRLTIFSCWPAHNMQLVPSDHDWYLSLVSEGAVDTVV